MCLRSKKSTHGRAAPTSGAGFRAIFGRKKAREAYWHAGFRGFYDAVHRPNEKAPLGAGFVAAQQKKKPLPGLGHCDQFQKRLHRICCVLGNV
jgi:hypothetical protein